MVNVTLATNSKTWAKDHMWARDQMDEDPQCLAPLRQAL